MISYDFSALRARALKHGVYVDREGYVPGMNVPRPQVPQLINLLDAGVDFSAAYNRLALDSSSSRSSCLRLRLS